MKIWKNIRSFLGYLAYTNVAMYFAVCFTCATLLIGISTLSTHSLFSFNLFLLLLGIMFYLSFLVGINSASSKINYRVAILKATKTLKELNKPGSCVNEEILAKISILSSKTQQAKDPTSLNEFIQKVQKYDQMKKNQKEKRELYKNLPDEINKLDTEIYLLESSLLP